MLLPLLYTEKRGSRGINNFPKVGESENSSTLNVPFIHPGIIFHKKLLSSLLVFSTALLARDTELEIYGPRNSRNSQNSKETQG